MDTLENPGQESFGIVEEALAAFPMEPVPETIYPAVMKQLEAVRPVQRFRIRWLDIVVSAFLSGMVVFTFLLLQSPLLPPTLIPMMKVRTVVFWQRLTVAARPFNPASFVSMLTISAGLCFTAVLVFLRSAFQNARTLK
jgi:hypothetical protein